MATKIWSWSGRKVRELPPQNEYFPYRPEEPWPKPEKKNCTFYHAMTLPDGSEVSGPWDIRGRFDEYIGHYPLRGKTVLDVGTATGFLAFEAEKRGAIVTATDAHSAIDMKSLPFQTSLHFANKAAWLAAMDPWLITLKNSFWFGWHEYKSKADVLYAPIDRLTLWDRKFDVVIAGAIVEHLSDPITAIGVFASLAKEAVIIGFTPVSANEGLILETATPWSSPEPEFSYTWWAVSRGLYKRIFANMGFDVEFVECEAVCNGVPASRPTIIARRISPQ
jgi:SAM-dependent methyltransferase